MSDSDDDSSVDMDVLVDEYNKCNNDSNDDNDSNNDNNSDDDDEKDLSQKQKHTKRTKKPKKKSITEIYLDYHDQYVEKFGYDRTLVLMQVGVFYEAYALSERGPDLDKLESLTEASVTHTGKNKKVIDYMNPLMWGFPMIASTKFIGILVENGYRLIMVDQITPKPNIKREVVAIHSPATYLESTYKPASNFIAAICIEEIKQKSNHVLTCVGMGAIDVSTGEVYIHESQSEINDDKLGLDETVRFLNALNPKEILIYKENLQKLTEDYIIEYLDLKGRFYQFRDINKDHCKAVYQKNLLEKVYAGKRNITNIIDLLGLTKTMYARKALVNILTYISDHYEELVRGIADPIFYLSNNCMTLGNDAINQLNIVSNTNSFDIPGNLRYQNLLDVVNKASTGMGKRYIKLRLISPYTEVKALNTIYDIVDVLIKDDKYLLYEQLLRQIQDVERMHRKLQLNNLFPMQLVEFMNSFKAIEQIFRLIKSHDDVVKHLPTNKFIDSVFNLNDLLDKSINHEKAKLYSLTDMKENIFNKGIYPELDKLSGKVNTNIDIMNELLEKLDNMINNKVENTNEGKIVSLNHNKRDGYYYQLTNKRYKQLATKLSKMKTIDLCTSKINVADFEPTEQGNNTKLTLPFLKEQTDNLDDLTERISNMTHSLYVQFLKDVQEKYGKIMEATIDVITKIDFYTTVAKIARTYNYTRPIIKNVQNNLGYIKAKNLRHPIVERIIDHEYVPHDINIGQDMKGMLIYGLNSAGKSVLMKAIGVNIIMAQAGFFTAAEQFEFYPYKSLYTRITGNDNLFRGLSSYSLEMVELNSILKRSNQSTLIIGDEVCRGTEHISGNALVATTLLRLASLGSTFVFATHLHELMELDELKTNQSIKAFHLSVDHDEKMDCLIYDRELKPGTGERIYGITVAKSIIKDEAFINKALQIKNLLLERDPNSPVMTTKKSRYNPDLLMDSCSICGKANKNGGGRALETHHINHQKDCDDKGFVKTKPHIQKNQIFNLLVVCQDCHDKIHGNKIEVEGIKMTSNGKKVIVKDVLTNGPTNGPTNSLVNSSKNFVKDDSKNDDDQASEKILNKIIKKSRPKASSKNEETKKVVEKVTKKVAQRVNNPVVTEKSSTDVKKNK